MNFLLYLALKYCMTEFATEYDYANFYKLSNLAGTKLKKHEIKLNVHVIGNRDANILLSPVEHPSYGKPAFEIGKRIV